MGRPFGVPVVVSQGMTADKFLVGAFPQAATIFASICWTS